MKKIIITLALSLGLVWTASATPILLVSTQGNGSGSGSCPTGPCGSAIGLVDAGTGLLSSLVNVTGLLAGEEIFDIAVDAAGEVYGVTNTRLYKINTTTGGTTLLGATGITGTNGLAFLGSTLYAVTNNSTTLYSLNTTNGAATSEGGWGGTEPNLASSGDIAFVNGRLFMAATGTGPDTRDLILELNLTGGIVNTGVNGLGSGVDGLKGLASANGNLYLAADYFGGSGSIRVIHVDINPGVNFGTVISSSLWNGTGAANAFGAPGGMAEGVPEPSVLMLSSLGLGLIGLSRLRRKKD